MEHISRCWKYNVVYRLGVGSWDKDTRPVSKAEGAEHHTPRAVGGLLESELSSWYGGSGTPHRGNRKCHVPILREVWEPRRRGPEVEGTQWEMQLEGWEGFFHDS